MMSPVQPTILFRGKNDAGDGGGETNGSMNLQTQRPQLFLMHRSVMEQSFIFRTMWRLCLSNRKLLCYSQTCQLPETIVGCSKQRMQTGVFCVKVTPPPPNPPPPSTPLGEFVGLLCYNSIVFLTPLLLTETPGLHALLNFPHSLLCETAGCASSVTHASVHYRRTWLCTLVISGCHLKEAGGSSWGQ